MARQYIVFGSAYFNMDMLWLILLVVEGKFAVGAGAVSGLKLKPYVVVLDW